MPDHPFHRTIGKLVKSFDLAQHKEIWLDPACDEASKQFVTLFHGTGPDRVRFCLVDILIIVRGKVVIIEIEESNVKPLNLFGKFFASTHATHHGNTEIAKLPLLFIQVLLEPERTRKGGQWGRIEEILKGHAKEWKSRKVEYELVRGGSAGFEAGGKEGEPLIRMTEVFLGEPQA